MHVGGDFISIIVIRLPNWSVGAGEEGTHQKEGKHSGSSGLDVSVTRCWEVKTSFQFWGWDSWMGVGMMNPQEQGWEWDHGDARWLQGKPQLQIVQRTNKVEHGVRFRMRPPNPSSSPWRWKKDETCEPVILILRSVLWKMGEEGIIYGLWGAVEEMTVVQGLAQCLSFSKNTVQWTVHHRLHEIMKVWTAWFIWEAQGCMESGLCCWLWIPLSDQWEMIPDSQIYSTEVELP